MGKGLFIKIYNRIFSRTSNENDVGIGNVIFNVSFPKISSSISKPDPISSSFEIYKNASFPLQKQLQPKLVSKALSAQ